MPRFGRPNGSYCGARPVRPEAALSIEGESEIGDSDRYRE